jgi:hypothetical protein
MERGSWRQEHPQPRPTPQLPAIQVSRFPEVQTDPCEPPIASRWAMTSEQGATLQEPVSLAERPWRAHSRPAPISESRTRTHTPPSVRDRHFVRYLPCPAANTKRGGALRPMCRFEDAGGCSITHRVVSDLCGSGWP